MTRITDDIVQMCIEAGFKAAPSLGTARARQAVVDDFTRAALAAFEAYVAPYPPRLTIGLDPAGESFTAYAVIASDGKVTATGRLDELPPELAEEYACLDAAADDEPYGDDPATEADARVRRGADQPRW